MRCQQDELYASEAAHGLRGRQFTSLDEIYEYVNALRDTWWWQRYYEGVLEVQVVGHQKGNSGSVGSWFPDKNVAVISMHEEHWCEQYVLHELAHPLAAYRYHSQAHCPWFARVYLELVANVMGSEAYVALHNGFDADQIAHDIPADSSQGNAIAC